MRYFFGGSEIKLWRNLLITEKVSTVSLSFVGLNRREKNLDKWSIADNYPDFQQVFLDSGAFTFNREDAEFTVEQARETAAYYMAFVERNIDALHMVSEFDAQILGRDVIENHRADFYNSLPPEKFMPVWHTEYGVNELEELCSAYSVVGICQADMRDQTLIPVFNSMVNRYGVRLHGVAVTSKKMMEDVLFDSVSSMSWLSPSIFGDTIIWTGKELKRYPRAYKSSRKQHRTFLTDKGFDAAKIENDDSTELLKLSLWSWQQFTDAIDHRTLTTHARNETAIFAENTTDTVGGQDPDIGNKQLVVRRETMTLPVMKVAFSRPDSDENSEEIPFVVSRSESMRVCNSCFLREKCPGFQANANCLYNIPIKITTKDQLRALRHALIEMQTQRVMFMQMTEDLEGGYADPNFSSELDRLNRMIKAEEDSEKQGFTMTISASSQNADPGVMAKFFGDEASQKMRALPAAFDADELIKNSDIVDAEVIDES